MVDFDGYYQGQCTDLFRQYIQEVLDHPQPKGVSGAADFWTNFDSDPNLHNFFTKIPNTPTGIPNTGDVIIWNKKAGGGFGHVAIFVRGNTTNFVSFDQNWPTLSVCTQTEHDYKNVYGWLRPNESAPTPPAEIVTGNIPKIDLETYGIMERQAILSSLKDKDKEITRLQQDNRELAKALQEAEKPTIIINEGVPCPDPTGSDTIDSLPPLPENILSDLFAWIGAKLKSVLRRDDATKKTT